jgi:hypothetical protein
MSFVTFRRPPVTAHLRVTSLIQDATVLKQNLKLKVNPAKFQPSLFIMTTLCTVVKFQSGCKDIDHLLLVLYTMVFRSSVTFAGRP